MWFETPPYCTNDGVYIAYVVNRVCGLGNAHGGLMMERQDACDGVHVWFGTCPTRTPNGVSVTYIVNTVCGLRQPLWTEMNKK